MKREYLNEIIKAITENEDKLVGEMEQAYKRACLTGNTFLIYVDRDGKTYREEAVDSSTYMIADDIVCICKYFEQAANEWEYDVDLSDIIEYASDEEISAYESWKKENPEDAEKDCECVQWFIDNTRDGGAFAKYDAYRIEELIDENVASRDFYSELEEVKKELERELYGRC